MTETDQHPTSQATDAKETAKEQVHNVAASTKDEAATVVETAKEQVQTVTADLREQTMHLTTEARSQLTDHAIAQRDNAVESLQSIGDELTEMADRADDPGIGAQLSREAGGVAHKTAEFLQDREPGQLVEELRSLARRRPGAFLLGAAVAGLIVGRATRSAKSAHSSDSGSGSSPDSQTAAAALPGTPYGLPTAPIHPAADPDAWGPESPAYPSSTSVDVQPGGLR